jgi:hypothetical protein
MIQVGATRIEEEEEEVRYIPEGSTTRFWRVRSQGRMSNRDGRHGDSTKQ